MWNNRLNNVRNIVMHISQVSQQTADAALKTSAQARNMPIGMSDICTVSTQLAPCVLQGH